MKRFITLDVNKKVDRERFAEFIVDGEIESDIGKIGQIQQAVGIFIDDTTPIIPPPYQPTNQEVYDSTITLMDVLATMYEGMIEKGTV